MGAARLWPEQPPSGTPSASEPPLFRSTTPLTARDWVYLAGLGIVGHVLYQFLFIGGLTRTSVANSSLMLATTPVLIAVISAALGHERIARAHWLGAAISTAGIYLVVGRGFAPRRRAAGGGPDDVRRGLLLGALHARGAAADVAALAGGRHRAVDGARHGRLRGRGLAEGPRGRLGRGRRAMTLGLLIYSALFALCLSYTIWYVAVRQIGSARTAAYSNLIPIVAMASAVLFLGEPIEGRKLLGAAAVLAGVALTRAGARSEAPAEE